MSHRYTVPEAAVMLGKSESRVKQLILLPQFYEFVDRQSPRRVLIPGNLITKMKKYLDELPSKGWPKGKARK